MRSKSKTKAATAGFTLLEVLVALVILGLAFGVNVTAIGSALTRLRTDAEEQSATMYAESVLARVGADIPLVDGQLTGSDGPLSWAVDIAPWNVPVQDEQQVVPAPVQAHSVAVSVSWPEEGRRRSFVLQTIRLQPAR